ncbi:MAG: hypothetical protein KBC46_07860 [Ferrovibrio sp.]|nr:hypothetical protein [Ferrovibrio sp.]
MATQVVINAASGTARRYGPEALGGLIREAALAQGQTDMRVHVVPPEALQGTLHRAANEAEEVWVGGGDGTLRSAAELLKKRGNQQGGILGVLPLGTMNLLARDLNIPLEIEHAVAALCQGDVTAIDLGRINDRLFLNKSALGLYPDMVVDRERRRRLWGLSKWGAMLRAAWRAVRRHRMMQIAIQHQGQRREILSPAIVVAVGAYEFRTGQLFGRPDLQSGELTVYISHEKNWLGSASQLAKLFLGTLDSDPRLEVIKADRLRIDFPRPKPVANDGEIDMLPGPIDYAVEPRALRVRLPKPAV